MFLEKDKDSGFSTNWVTDLLHFLRLHQVVYQLTLVITILFFRPDASLFELFSAFCMIVLITPTFLLVQDILGKKDDEKANQKRILFSEKFNKIFFYTSLLVMLIILILNNILSLIIYILLFISTLCYAATKHYRKMIVAYVFRYLSSVFTLLLYIFILVGSLNSNYYFFISIVTILDLVGNIAGDIRDSRKDTIAGVKTFVTTLGMRATLQLMSLLVLTVFGLLIIHFRSPILLIVLIINVLQFILVEQLPVKFSHGIFHLGKLINFLIIAEILTNPMPELFVIVTGFIVTVWFLSYYFYLFNVGTLFHA